MPPSMLPHKLIMTTDNNIETAEYVTVPIVFQDMSLNFILSFLI